MVSISAGTGARVALAAVGDAAVWEAQLSQALAVTGTALVGPAEPGDLTVVLLPPGQASDDAAAELAGLQLADPIIPVVIGPAASSLLGDRSQLVRPPTALGDVAERISALARLGGADLVEVNDLVSAARRWVANGRQPADLLGAVRTPEALSLAALAGSVDHADAPLAAEFAGASAGHQARQRRGRRRIVIATAAVLSLAIVAALAMKVVADRAAADARRQAAVATSNRLTGVVTQMLRSNPDPDLPWLLAGRAVSANPSPEAVTAARLVQDAIPAHRSIRLPQRPVGLATAATGLIALVSVDHSVDLLDPTGSTVRTFPAGAAAGAIALADDGTRLALASESGILLNASGADGFPQAADVHAAITDTVVGLAWASDSLIVATPAGLVALAPDGAGSELPFRPAVGAITGVAGSPDGRRLAVWGTTGLWVGDADGGNPFTTGSTDVGMAVFTADASSLYTLSRSGGVGHVEFPPGEAAVVVAGSIGAYSIFRVGGEVGAVKLPGAICPLSPPADDASRCLTAHAGGIVGAGSLGAARGFATAGTDQYLRIWTSLGAGTYGRSEANGTSRGGRLFEAPGVYSSGANALQGRSRLECDTTDDVCWALSAEPGVLVALDSQLHAIRALYLGVQGILNHALSDGGRFAGRHSSDKGVTVSSLHSRAALTDLWQSTQTGAWVNAVDALAPDASTYVSASSTTVSFWTGAGVTSLPGPKANPVGVVFGQGYGPTVYFADGSTVHSGTSEPAALNVGLRAVTEVTVDGVGQLWWVNDRNEVTVSDDRGVRVVATLATALAPYAMRVAPDGRHVAIFDPRQVLVLAASDGTVRYAAIASSVIGAVDDIAFDGDQALTIEHSGAVRRVSLTDAATFVATFSDALPRDLTPEETSLFAVPQQG